jgi:hypothetical protein
VLLALLLLGGGAYYAQMRRKSEALARWKRAPIVMPTPRARSAEWSAKTLAKNSKIAQNPRQRHIIEAAQKSASRVSSLALICCPKIATPLTCQNFKQGPTHDALHFPKASPRVRL